MNLNIKNEETYQLASALAALTGESLTKAVTEALRERLERLRQHQRKATAAELVAIGQRCAAHILQPMVSLAHGEALYDERGLPQ